MSHKALIGIVGPSGSGKSTSLENLPREATVVIDCERKGFPFLLKGLKVIPASNPSEYSAAMAVCIKDSAIRVIVVESFTKCSDQILILCQLSYKGYDIYGNYTKMVKNLINNCKNDHAVVVFTAIDDIIDIPNPDGSSVAARRIGVSGKEMKGKIEQDFLMVFFTEPKKGPDGKMKYYFQTNTDGITSAKTPKGMFDEQLIPNDLATILSRAEAFYREETK